jgi:Fungal Zn(2)-Cys(6) binuclear cluster domain
MTISPIASASGAENHASLPSSSPSAAPALVPKLRSCVVCRSRKVRCDKRSPCSNCRRANIACVLPSTDRPPRWARRLNQHAATESIPAPRDADLGVDKVMDRLRHLENLVKELSGQLEQARAATALATSSDNSGSLGSQLPGNSILNHEEENGREHQVDTGDVHKQFGRLVLQSASSSRYVSSGFWSRVDDEVGRPL